MRPCLVLSRPEAQSLSFAQAAQAAGWRGEVLVAPVLEITLRPPDARLCAQARVLIFTSQHGVESFAQATSARHWPVWCVGPRTVEAARKAGFAEIAQAEGGDAASLLAGIAAAAVEGPFLHLHGAHLACDLSAHLRARGHQATGQVVYTQDARPLGPEAQARLAQGGDLVLAVFSPRSAALLGAELAPLDLAGARLHAVAISAQAAAPLRGLSLVQEVLALRPDASGMLAALLEVQAALEPSEKPS